ncbi:ABC transporter substrate-binding protein [Pseudoalteromonas sp. McH1-7]|uniref:Phospholipid transport system substrate-binding protein n=1 Tax=Pseudoalteromonas peptidolytica F12-50-A1 TaxID=1315280 RepID=A0A8I0MSI0_9GAMM|nr:MULTISPECIES: ABC transporter substrate-binding protein [Pseudoalteromonas]MBE0344916.1 phospholipid transport system substrate-binding protein [Pseudoalteromonas peptidolytica F12-50-A1]MDW7550471.1 ABC transporter substrate-binding protein [Pseudoalteromonas peptidolytica]NLR16627.1 toluene tolerance protein [Pseudoalteromonas peptidolytica]NUZ11814.1 ABC transporter substrate-binding protein [Pseudoalteromonas sp. McH1-7]RRS09921.1 toluene tolerance protein [Pseudoalteromonas sp. J010]
MLMNLYTKCLIWLVAIMVTMSLQAKEVDSSDPYKMVEQVAAQTFQRVTKEQSIIEKDKEHLRVIVEEELLPYIDYKYAAYRVLGSYIQTVRNIEDKQEKAAAVEHIKTFIEVFKSYLVATYAGVFTQYKDQKVEFGEHRPFDKEDIAIVKTKIVEAGKPDIKIDFKVRRGKDNDWRAFDMMAEGISLLDAKQSELHGILRQQGIEHVIQLLDKKSKLPVQFRGDDGDA